jgi:hypothetical protein
MVRARHDDVAILEHLHADKAILGYRKLVIAKHEIEGAGPQRPHHQIRPGIAGDEL